MCLNGYIDESKDGELFTLSCLTGHGVAWEQLDRDWRDILARTNKELKAQNRPLISRYHASDCSTLHGEFSGWEKSEQIAFSQSLFDAMGKYRLDVAAYTISIAELIETIPEASSNPECFAYVVLLFFVMSEIGDFTITREGPDTAITLIHERCDYDAAVLEAFNQAIVDPNFQYGLHFKTIAPMSPFDCIPLQPADLMAYENMKQSQIEKGLRKGRMRHSLKDIINNGVMGGRLRGFDKATLKLLKDRVDSMDSEVRDLFYHMIRRKSPAGNSHAKPNRNQRS